MSCIAVFKVFKNSYLETPRGEYQIEQVFPTRKAANEAGYVYYFTHQNLAIFSHHSDENPTQFAVVSA